MRIRRRILRPVKPCVRLPTLTCPVLSQGCTIGPITHFQSLWPFRNALVCQRWRSSKLSICCCFLSLILLSFLIQGLFKVWSSNFWLGPFKSSCDRSIRPVELEVNQKSVIRLKTLVVKSIEIPCFRSGTKSLLEKAVIHLQFWAYESWDSLFPISLSPNCKLMSPKHYF